MFNIVISWLILIVASLLYIIITRSIAYSHNSKLFELVAWCVTDDSKEYRCNLSLTNYIHNAQINTNLPAVYHISGDDEWAYSKVILQGFNDYLIQSYFCNTLPYKKSKYVIPGEDFFMYHLFCYLSDHECDRSFLGNQMHQETKSYKSYGTWGGPLFDATYKLTDFAIVLHKLHYITYSYCKESVIYKNDIAGWLTSKHFTDVLDSRQVDISRI